MLLLKLFLVPSLVAPITLTGLRWGPVTGSWLSGFPGVAGPSLFFIALDQGPVFAAQAACKNLIAALAKVTFGIVCAWIALRCRWYTMAMAGVLAFVLIGSLLGIVQ